MRISLLSLCVSLAGLAVTAPQTADAGCEILAGQPIQDQQLWAKIRGRWLNFDTVQELPEGGSWKVPFIYVIARPFAGDGATGAIVIKSGRKNVPGGIRGPDTVRLVRDPASSTAYCEVAGNSEFFNRTNVRKKAYDEYHDYDYAADKTSGGAEFAASIKNFHVGLKGTQPGQCMHTDASEDFSGQWIRRNMRSQFSFDRAIVDGGMSAHYVTAAKIALGTIFTTGLAGGSDGFNSQRSEIKSYEIKHGVACVKFFASVARRDFIVRVNDLGARMSNLWLATEKRWER